MDSLLSPVTANFTADIEEVALNRAPYKPTCWFCYVDVIWTRGLEEMK